MWWATVVSSVLFGILMAAFVFLGLVVVAYAGPVGWAAVGATAFFGTLGFGSIVWQSPIGSNPPEADGWRLDAMKRETPTRGPSYRGNQAVLRNPDEKDVPETGAVRGNEQNGHGRQRSHETRRHSIEVPGYTEELRRNRANKNSSGYPHYSGRNI